MHRATVQALFGYIKVRSVTLDTSQAVWKQFRLRTFVGPVAVYDPLGQRVKKFKPNRCIPSSMILVFNAIRPDVSPDLLFCYNFQGRNYQFSYVTQCNLTVTGHTCPSAFIFKRYAGKFDPVSSSLCCCNQLNNV